MPFLAHRCSRLAALISIAVLTFAASVAVAQATYPGQNGVITFNSGYEAINLDGTGRHVMPVPGVWSPSGLTLAYWKGSDLYHSAADGTGETFVTSGGGDRPTWSPDGTKLAFMRGSQLVIVRSDGLNAQVIPFGSARGLEWSPLGDRFAFERNDDIWTASIDGTNQINLTGAHVDPMGNSRIEESNPSWAPDGSKIAFEQYNGNSSSCSYSSGIECVQTINADGSGYTDGHVPGRDPAWSPDGAYIVSMWYCRDCTEDHPDTDHLLLSPVATFGSNFRFITNTLAAGTPLAWQPIPPNYSDAPQTMVSVGPPALTVDPTPTFEFSSSESNSTFKCRVDSNLESGFQPCSSPYTLSTRSDGPHIFEVRATDQAGNTDASPATRKFTVDTVAPQTTIGSGPPAATNDSTPTFEFSSSEPSSTFKCRVDSNLESDFQPCSSPYTLTSRSDGPHTFEVRATDQAGITDQSPASRSFAVDTALPQTTIVSGPPAATNDSTPTFEFSSSESNSTFKCRVDSNLESGFQPCSSPSTLTARPDGAHTFEVRATDQAGNTDASPASRSFTVDTVAPQTMISFGPSDSTGDSTPTFEFWSTEDGSTFKCRVDSTQESDFKPCTAPHTLAALSAGPHTFEVRATDQAGNNDTTPASRSFTVLDTVAPQTTIDSGPTGPTSDPTPTFSFSSSEPASTYECRVDSASFAPCGSPHTTSELTPGPHTFEVRATDSATNTDQTPASRPFTVLDTSGPQTAIDSGPSGSTTDQTPTFSFSSSEPGSTFECRVDAGPFAPCGSPYTTDILVSGAHSFEVRATDAFGNTDQTPANRPFTVLDTIAPQTVISAGPSGSTIDPTPTFSFSSNEAGSTFECRVDGWGFAPCDSPHTTNELAAGAHILEVRAIDSAGNTDQTPASRLFTVLAPSSPATTPSTGGSISDTIGPVVTISPRVARLDSRGRVVVRLRCPISEPGGCTGTLSLEAAKPKVKLAKSSAFQIAGGKSVRVVVRLSKKSQRLARRLKKLVVKVTVEARDAAGNTKTTKRSLTLRAALP